MTRLREKDIEHIAGRLHEYDAHLKRIAGASLREIACNAAGVEETQILDLLDRVRFAAVPVRSGLGVIGGFSGTVAAILSHLGFDAFVTVSCDVTGMVESFERGADVLLMADDESFVAIDPRRSSVLDNSRATALGFVAGLELMKGGLRGESVLVLGCGPVGVAAGRALLDRGAYVALCDLEKERALAAQRELGKDVSGRIRLEENSLDALTHYEVIFDATDEGGFIDPAHLNQHSFVAAPGMPCGLTPEALEEHRDRILHDALEIGVATLAVQAAVDQTISVATKRAHRE